MHTSSATAVLYKQPSEINSLSELSDFVDKLFLLFTRKYSLGTTFLKMHIYMNTLKSPLNARECTLNASVTQ